MNAGPLRELCRAANCRADYWIANHYHLKANLLQKMTRFTKLKKLINDDPKRNTLKLIKWLQKKKLLKTKVKCRICHHGMKLKKRANSGDQYAWTCRHVGTEKQISVRHKSIFSRSKISFSNWMQFMYRFCQGLRLRQIDMMDDSIAASSATLSKMAKKLREVCVTAVERMRRRTGQKIGGRREFVVIDESHFRHKRKYGRGRMVGGWKRKKWVFGMLGVKHHQGRTSRKPVLRLVERRSRGHLVPLIAHHVRRGSSIISDEWRAYRILPALGYNHHTVNHSRWYVDPHTGAHTQHIERAWRSYKEQIWRLRGNRTDSLLSDHLAIIEWNEWLAKKHHNGAFGRLIHDISRKYK
ncbi:uncharacterized protein LOC116695630 [Etheostoma spectabile]|uniref:uncharacterized protein LOC116695630 n=1 Tax=Etheostoma spectabile TaxID=54343 RepID=UPI0013AF4A46|nr:uncharacterized protein LOC116695630 [Etheostoma spectabile]